MTNTTKVIILLAIIVLSGAVVASTIRANHRSEDSEVPEPDNSIAANEVKFGGTVSAYSTGCFADGICSVTVAGKEVIVAIDQVADKK